jgi:predicted ArsR family transcriptional regulator
VAARQCLALLEKAGVVATSLDRRRIGRPAYLYSLTDKAGAFFPNEYADFVNRVLGAIVQLDGEEKVATIFKQMKKNAVTQHAPRMAGKSFRERVAEMAKIQSQSGYMAEWKQLDHHTFQITEHNCAIARVAQQCQHACVCELAMFRELLQATVNRQEHIVDGDPCCRYIVQSLQARKPAKGRKLQPPRTQAI